MRRVIILFILALKGVLAQSPFLQKPYLQIGNAASLASLESIAVLWHTPDREGEWKVEYRQRSGEWRSEQAFLLRRVNVRGLQPHRIYQGVLTGLAPGVEFEYRVTLDGKTVFDARSRARRAAGDPYKFAIYGDMSEDSDGQKALAWQIYQAKPEYLLSVGDLVYSRGLASEYYRKYFPIYNCDEAEKDKCAPLLRSFPTVAVLGNHDAPNHVDLGALPDALAYFYYWSQPLNGPVADRNAGNSPQLKGSSDVLREFTRAAPNFPRMGIFSFDYGDVHWLMLDSNPYVDWNDPALREWVRKDLRSAGKAAWRMVAMHHPAFQSAHHHFDDQWMRSMWDVFEEGRVSIVFSGHVHNYQRSYPIHFKIKDGAEKRRPLKKGKISGDIVIDKTFDGHANTKANGLIQIVTGAGGADLYNAEQEFNRSSWQDYTAKFAATMHSFTLVEVTAKALKVRQIAKDGRQLDEFTLTQ